MTELASELATELAQEFGIVVASGEKAAIVTAFLSTEALKAGLELVIPSVASGMAFSTTGLTLAFIQHQIRNLHKKVDVLLDASKRMAKDKLDEALVAFENGNFKDACEDFKTVSSKAGEAFNQSQDNEGRIFATKLKLLSHLMVKSYDEEQQVFLPFPLLPKPRQREVGALMRNAVDKLLAELKVFKPTFVDSIKFKNKVKHKRQVDKINEILTTAYPFITSGLGWTRPRDVIVNMQSDVIQVEIDPTYVPQGKDAALQVPVGRTADGTVVSIEVYRLLVEKSYKLLVQSSEFVINDSIDNRLMLEVFCSKIVAFRDETAMLFSASRTGKDNIIASLLNANPDLDVNAHNLKRESALHLAVQNEHTRTIEVLLKHSARVSATDGKEYTALHYASERGLPEVVRVLIENKADTQAVNKDGATALFLAAEAGHCQVTKQLILADPPSINIPGLDGMTPLYLAAKNNHREVVELLCRKEANYTAKRTSDGTTPLWMASHEGHLGVVQVLSQHMSRHEIKCPDDSGRSPRKIARERGHLEVSRHLKRQERASVFARCFLGAS